MREFFRGLPRAFTDRLKAGTVVNAADLSRAIREAKAGRVEFRLDKTANIHVSVGKVSFTADQLYDNFAALMSAVHKARPAGAKGEYIKDVVADRSKDTELGKGVVEIRRLLAAVPDIAAKPVYVEQEESADSMASARVNYAYLRTLDF